MGRVVAIGLDGASIDLVDELCDDGSLPCLARLRSSSARMGLRSGPAHRHGMHWTQFASGVPFSVEAPEFRCSFDADTYVPFEDTARHEFAGVGPFWERSDASTITFDVPRSTVAGPGVHVTAWGAHAAAYPRASEPRGLLREIDRRFGVHPAFDNDYECGWHDPDRLEHLTRALELGARRRAEISTFLMERFPRWDLFVTVMSEAHSASEVMWHAVDAHHPLAGHDPHSRARLIRVFQAMDRSIETLLRALRPDDTVFLFSLDGMTSSHGDLPSIVLLPELLHRQQIGTGLLRDPDLVAWRRRGCPPLVPRRGGPWRHELDRRLIEPRHTPLQRVQRLPIYAAARSSAPGRRVLERVKRRPLGALGVPIPPESDDSPATFERTRQRLDEIVFAGNYRPYWPRMRSFALPSFGDGYLRINLEGRERDGRVAIDEYDDERRALDALVGACRDARTGLPVSDGIEWIGASTEHDLRRRPYADGIVHWTRPIDAFEHPALGTIGPFPLHRTGTHTEAGFLWASGPGFTAGAREERSALDLPPTILAALDASATLPAGTPIA